MKITLQIFIGLTYLVPGAWAQNSHEALPPSPISTPNSQEAKDSGSKPFPSPSDGQDVEVSDYWSSLSTEEKKYASKLILFWSLTNKEEPSQYILESSGMSPGDFKKVQNSLSSDFLMSFKEKKILRSDFSDDQLTSRFQSRRKTIKIVDKLQIDSTDFRGILPEMLTVWGEARGIKGFTEKEDSLQQAKMASIIHVLRNRSLNRIDQLKKKGENPLDYLEKWKVATTRFQFSAFEPYDPNLAELSLGPLKQKTPWSLESLPKNDQRALVNLARVMAKLDSGKIKIPEPLGQPNTRHYLTPTLVKYDLKKETRLRKTWKNHPRFHVLKIPTQKSAFLAVVPNWALQDKLISNPPVMLQGEKKESTEEVKIPPADFVYFWGIL